MLGEGVGCGWDMLTFYIKPPPSMLITQTLNRYRDATSV